ncbi:hypothetical protein ASE27_10340 [Oerskovia sp. Root918]|uniref:tyrosine-type recombinase/integrase n=1 Tax=Oerskovia sp. Root918 TaxID=1736607 RepID=UPI0006FE233A|nr:site-specific integrase [Oerskovia sp. Root918]KRD36846.1 hypothetical protein ASE27_10340 [Oerskovia sp. Root918]
MASKTGRRDAGAGALYQRASDGLWCVSVTLPSHDGKRRRKTIASKTKEGAQAKLRALQRELARNGDLPTASPTLTQWIDRWLNQIAVKRLKPRTFDSYRGVIDRYILPSIGRIRLDKLTTAHVRQMHDYVTVTRGLSTTTALQAHRVLAKCLTDAERDGMVMRNVATLVDAPQKAVVERDALSADQAIALLRSVADDPHGAPRWSLALFAGMRQGECLGLTREFVDLESGTITVAWQLQRLTWKHGCGTKTGSGWPCAKARAGYCPSRHMNIPEGQEARQVHGNLWLLRPKSRTSWRRVPMAATLWQVMRRHLESVQGDLVFTTPAGLPWDPSDDWEAWGEALKQAGLPHMPLHSARHSTATLLYKLGVPEQTRMEILGHSSATTTAGYTHIDITMAREAMSAFDGLLALEQ